MSSLNAGKGSVSCDVLDGGFAKLHGQGFDYYIQFYEIILGRNTKKQKVDLDLTKVGASKDVSRRHARIYYDFKDHTFALEVIGRSGCYVQRVLYLPGDDPVKLDSQDLIQIGDIQFYFLRSSQHIDEYIAAQGTSQSFTFRNITYHVDPATASVEHTPTLDEIRKYKETTPIPSKPMPNTSSAHQHTPIPSQPVSATASAQHNHIASQTMPSSSMRPVHPDFSALLDYNCGNSHGGANGDSGTAIGTGIQKVFMKQNNRSLVGLDLNLEPIIEILEEDGICARSHLLYFFPIFLMYQPKIHTKKSSQ
jgi:predicted component of type VI protein secretion system